MKKKRLIISGILLGLLSLGVINASLYWDSGYASKKVSLDGKSEREIAEAFDIAAGGELFSDVINNGSNDVHVKGSSVKLALHQSQDNGLIIVGESQFVPAPEKSEPQLSELSPISIGGGMTQQGGTSSHSVSAGAAAFNAGTYSGGYTRHADDNGIWNSIKPTFSMSQEGAGGSSPIKEGTTSSTPDPEVNPIDGGDPASVPDSGATVWLFGLSLLALRLFVTRNRTAHI
jgi:hypothetical protein